MRYQNPATTVLTQSYVYASAFKCMPNMLWHTLTDHQSANASITREAPHCLNCTSAQHIGHECFHLPPLAPSGAQLEKLGACRPLGDLE